MQSSGKFLQRALGAISAVGLVGVMGGGCITRPIAQGTPSTKTNFTAVVRQAAVDKVDLLFMIDNSASMGDKQDLLGKAVPDMMQRLVSPNCVDKDGKPTGQTTSDGTCPNGGKAEFPPVHDMHVGIVSSSLGGAGSNQCADVTDGKPTPRNNDKGYLLNRTGTNLSPSQQAPDNFLAWYPQTDVNAGHVVPKLPIDDVKTLDDAFTAMVTGVHEDGCGYEAQLESWYRFLVQPDPYSSIALDASAENSARLVGIDRNILQQRHDFLRPDSLLAIVLLTDENDSAVDPLALGGKAWWYENTGPTAWTTQAVKGTTQCDTDPNSDACLSCAYCQSNGQPAAVCGDANCAGGGAYDTAHDSLNVRFFHMKQRFGVDPQFPITRYVDGLKLANVPDRRSEHDGNLAGGNYVGDDPAQKKCINPIFATGLPDQTAVSDAAAANADDATLDALCNLTKGPRTSDLVYFAVIGGVPWQLLVEDPANAANSPFKAKLVEADFLKLLGKDPLHYDFTGADPHMVESIESRFGNKKIDPNNQLHAPTETSNTADPYNGHEFDTKLGDLQYACTFELPQPKTCLDNSCDCKPNRKSTDAEPPLCQAIAPNAGDNIQIRGKAYPTVREFSVVRQIGDQGIVASLCPRSLDEKSANFGYRPAVNTIVDRLKNALANQCLPQPLTAVDGQVPCLILVALTDAEGGEDKCVPQGLTVPDAQVLATFRQQQQADYVAGGGAKAGLPDPAKFPVCQLTQKVVPAGETCANDADAGWCYVQNTPTQSPAGAACQQSILFTATGTRPGAKISLQCIESGAATAGTSGTAGDAGSP